VIEPCYDSYVPNILLAGGVPRFVAMRPDFSVDWQAVQDAVSPRTKAILTNTPHNPSGRVFQAADLLALEAIVEKHDLIVIADEVYEHMVFDAAEHQSASRYDALAQRSFVVSSFGKTFHVTGWKIAYCAAPERLMKEFRKVHQFAVFTVNAPAQEGVATYLQNPKPYLELPSFYQAKRDFLRVALERTALQLLPCEGTYFQLASFAKLTPSPALALSADDLATELAFAHWLTRNCGVTVIPVSAFYNGQGAKSTEQQLVRFCFAKQTSTLEQAAQRLVKLM
jgi:methionine transaminase